MKHSARLLVLSTLIAAGGLSLAVGAASARENRPSFEMLDTNGDGAISKAEMKAHADARRASLDNDGDGLLSLEELTARGQERAAKRAERMMSRLDTNGDKQLSQEELAAVERRGDKRFDRVDADGDGQISRAEFDEMADKRGGKRKPKKD